MSTSAYKPIQNNGSAFLTWFGKCAPVLSLLWGCSADGTPAAGSSNPNSTATTTALDTSSASNSSSPSTSPGPAATSTVPTQPGPVATNTSSSSNSPETTTSGTSTAAPDAESSGEPLPQATETPQTSSSEPTASAPSSEANVSSGVSPTAEEATIVPDPSWACGVPDGLPPPQLGALVFEATVELGDTHEFGETPYGTRRLRDVKGATFEGERISGSFLTGGLELELELANGALELEQIDILRTSDGTLVYMRSCGFAPSGETVSRFVPDFEINNSSAHAWLNSGKYAGTRTVDAAGKTITLAVYDMKDVAPGEPRIQLEDPAGVPDQPWDCATSNAGRGATVFTETVTLGSSLSVGASKRGTRNIIPITGGTVTGRLTGKVVPGGADYQLIGGTTVLDARYSLVGDGGDYVLVRNCGPFGALIPQFEAAVDGPYAFLNTGKYLSSDPGSAGGGVSITFYEAQ